MHELIAWCGFVGAWLLVAGPLYQAAIELEEESLDRDEFRLSPDQVPRPDPVSPWWWLIPPVGYWLNRRRAGRHRTAMLAAMTPVQLEKLLRFQGKATGWIFVAGGAFFIAVKETYELIEEYETPEWLIVPVVLVMIVLAAANTVVRTRRSHALLGQESRR